MLSLELSDAGASIVMMDMRYMWSEMDSPVSMPKRRQPSRLVVLRRVRRWRKERGVSGWVVLGRDDGARAARAEGCWLAFGRVEVWCLPDWTDHLSSGADGGGGAMETAFRMSLDSEWLFGGALSSGEVGVDMSGDLWDEWEGRVGG